MQLDKSKSFFVGDAAGRSTDHAGTDRKWAENVNIPFLTPEARLSSSFSPSISHRRHSGIFPQTPSRTIHFIRVQCIFTSRSYVNPRHPVDINHSYSWCSASLYSSWHHPRSPCQLLVRDHAICWLPGVREKHFVSPTFRTRRLHSYQSGYPSYPW